MTGTLKKISLADMASGVRMFLFADLDESNRLMVGSFCKVLQVWGATQYVGFVVVDDAEERYTEINWDSKTWTGGVTRIDLCGARCMAPGQSCVRSTRPTWLLIGPCWTCRRLYAKTHEAR